MSLRRLAFLACTGILLSFSGRPLRAQPSHGYIFFAPGGITCCHNTSMTLQFGGGGEYVIKKGVGVGAELSVVGARQSFGDSAMGLFSPNGFYHFVHGQDIKADPFVTGGYTLLFRSYHANLANFGGGMNYWLARRVGVRLELRDQLNTTGTIAHFWGVRFGVAFR